MDASNPARAGLRPAAIVLVTLALAVSAGPARAEKADRDRPTQIEAQRMSSDDARRITIFEGNVVLTKGTISVRADRIVVRQDAEGFQFTTATGTPVRFRQRADPRDGQKEGLWMDGEALRIELDDRNERIELFDRARVTRGEDEIRGNYIFVDQRTEFFSASGAKGGGEGRVRAVIQPRTIPGDAPAPAPLPARP